ncbi:MAG: hypothetical protein B7Z58_01985 [Acidiphilium sp. 37-64-53]|uniref:hypothetical protein n=1 Tax=Acidiphilium TaxID=522 RepID=UPI000BCF69E1|nr:MULTISPECIES: hypothetical protein [Acidiphilium]OYW03717.1 MAG: hypothetical protein B7Z58_01985 [Acidiphilium sp. 37-64-53]OZB30455.1 MAG: hypothetical protein B7X49_03175 [Acidiphilium sp. 34-64-41]HQT83611.1 hypothetical protein [Acidiphilium rubrum]
MSGFTLRAHEKDDAPATAALLMRPAVRHGTMVFAPYTPLATATEHMAAPVNGANIVAVSDSHAMARLIDPPHYVATP